MSKVSKPRTDRPAPPAPGTPTDPTRRARGTAASERAGFLALLSHEVRTSLQAVIGASVMLSQRFEGQAKPRELRTLEAATRSLMGLVESILNYSRLQSGTVQPQDTAFALRPCIDDAVQVATATLERPQVRLRQVLAPNVPARIVGDEGLLRQVLINLIGNALKFTERGEVRIHVETLPPQPGDAADALRLQFTVSDTGRGISRATQERLFKPFQRGSVQDGPAAAGSGLGLVICAMIVRLFDGDIALHSALGEGTTVRFQISAREAAAQPAVSAPEPLHVLVVEDNAINRELLVSMLLQLGHRVEAAGDGAAAVDKALSERGPFDVVLMDFNLPHMNGPEAAREIIARSQRLGRRPPVIIALTASVSADDRAACRAAGMEGFLGKPVTLERFDAVLAEVSALRTTAADAVDGATLLDRVMLDALAAVDDRAERPFLRPLIGRFIAGQPEAVARIEAARAADDAVALKLAAHELAGTAAMVGAAALAALARQLMTTAQADDVARLAALSRQSCAALQVWAQGLRE